MWRAPDSFEKKLRIVVLRCNVNVLLEHFGRMLAAGGVLLALVVLFERTTAIRIVNSLVAWTLGGGVIALTLLLWSLRRPSVMDAAIMVDERAGTKERFSTALALAGRDDPFCKASIAEAHRTAERFNVKTHFPLGPSRSWLFATVAWLAAASVFFFVPTMDLFARQEKQRADQESAQKIEQAKAAVKEATSSIKLAVNLLDDEALKEQFAKLGDANKSARPEEIRRQAIRKLGDMSDRIKKLQSDKNLPAGKMMQSMLGRLRGPQGGLSPRLNQAIAKGNFAQASNLIRQLQRQLAEGKLSQKQREALEKQLADLAKQLKQLAGDNKKLEEELEKAGLDKALAKMNEEELRKALQRQGLSKEKIEELLEKAAACRSASSRCSQLGEAMAACGAGAGGLSAEELAELAGQLDSLEALKQDLALTEASLTEIKCAIACLGEGECKGGCTSPWKEGLALRQGPGTGGPGLGFGPRSTGEEEDTTMQKTRVKNKQTKQGPIIASWYFKGPQAKGQSRRELTDVVQAAKDRSSESVSENRIPRKYESSIKKYFGQLEEQNE